MQQLLKKKKASLRQGGWRVSSPCYQNLAPVLRHWVVVMGKNQFSPSQWGCARQQLQPQCVCTQQEGDPKIATLNALGIDRAIQGAAKWTLMYYKVPVGAAQTKLFSLLPIHQEGIIYWGEKKNSWFLNWAKLPCHGWEWASETPVGEMKRTVLLKAHSVSIAATPKPRVTAH